MYKPLAYALTVKTSFEQSAFSGTAEILLEILMSTRCLVLNSAAPLRVLGAVLVQEDAKLKLLHTQSNEEEETISFHFEEGIKPGKATLGLRWEGQLDSEARFGYYSIPCKEKEPEGERYAVTHFQPTMARRALPCFDHPEEKATFDISLVSPVGYISLSNMPELERSPSDGSFPSSQILSNEFLGNTAKSSETEWELIRFKASPVMSTYLVAWAVGRFSFASSTCVSPLSNTEIPLRIYAARARQHIERGFGERALDTLRRAMPIYERIFDVPYEYEKVDILVCDAFDTGAMENPGLITGRPLQLLHDPATGGRRSEMLVTTTISHEASHFWFGDHVSMRFWDELWLNEGFASWLGEIVVLDELEPEWNVEVDFVRTHQARAFKLDSLLSSHPVHLPVLKNLPSAVAEAFDVISYEKGSTILRMLSRTIGKEAFILGVSSYLKRHAHGNTTSLDLWKAMSEASGIDVESMMDAWTNKVGLPVVTVEEVPEGLKLRQNRFLSSGSVREEDDQTVWTIPLGLKVLGGPPIEPLLMSTREMVIAKPEGLYILNAEVAGLFRVSYPSSHLSLLASEAISPACRLSLSDRLGLLQDVVALSSAGHTSTSSALAFIRTLAKATTSLDYFLWHEMAEAIRSLIDCWWEQPLEVQDGIKAFGRALFELMLEALGWEYDESDSAERKNLKSLVVGAACVAEVPTAIDWSRRSFQLLLTSQAPPTSLIADLAPIIICTTVKHGSQTDFDIVFQIYQNPPTAAHQMGAIMGLTCSTDPSQLARLAGMLGTGEVGAENMGTFLYGLASNPLSRRMVWSLVAAAWPMLQARFGDSSTLSKIVEVSIEGFSAEEDAAQIESYFEGKNLTGYEYALKQGLEKIRSRAGWLKRDVGDVETWLRQERYM